MEQEPKYKLGQKVWFVTENEKLCYGTITQITPINYTLNYNIKMVLDSVGEVIKHTVWESAILGEYGSDETDIAYKASAYGIAKDIDERILRSLIADKHYEKKEPNFNTWRKTVKDTLENFDNKYTEYKMGTVEPVYEYGLERDFNVKCDLAFILGAIEKYGKTEGCYADLAGYIMNMVFMMVKDMRSNVNNEDKKEEKNEQSTR